MNRFFTGYAHKEINTVLVKKHARFKIVLVFPNSYHIGMSNLGFQTIYYELNKMPDASCERFFYEPGRKFLSLESNNPLKSFDIIAFSVSYELDYLNILHILKNIDLPLERSKRSTMPLLIMGGAVCAINYLPLANFMDLVFVGEAEESLPGFMTKLINFSSINTGQKKERLLQTTSKIKGVFIPQLHANEQISPGIIKDVNLYPTMSRVITTRTEFANTFLIEISRGCPWRCRFCVTGNIFGHFRPRRLDVLINQANFGLKYTSQVGLVGAAICNHPQIDEFVTRLREKKARISVSSLRINNVSMILLKSLAESGQKTVTFAPEAGSEKLRQILNKQLTDAEMLAKIELAKKAGIKKIKLYFMIGLPQEEQEDILAIVKLVKNARQILPTIVHLGIFVPKPKTPFSQEKIKARKLIRGRFNFLKKVFSTEKNIEFDVASLRQAMQEAQFAKADQHFFKYFVRD
ncbi:MAG: radical SAM protein [Gammaproteobacteria bacterium]|nr:radical SAM protein [Gammaproteobacteria bacterium]